MYTLKELLIRLWEHVWIKVKWWNVLFILGLNDCLPMIVSNKTWRQTVTNLKWVYGWQTVGIETSGSRILLEEIKTI